MKCLVLAAGGGTRLRPRAESKPLLPLLGVPLIERCIRSAREAGAREFVVVTGHAGEAVSEFLHDLARRLRVSITTAVNPHWDSTENGHSILAAEGLIDEPFLLLMADHLFEPALARRLLEAELPEDGLLLAVDGYLDNPLVDLEDVTRVRRADGHIAAIGKGLAEYDGYDTGVFLCSPALFAAVRAAEDTTLSAAVRHMAAAGRALAVDVGGLFWCDVDDEAALARAEAALLARLRDKVNDGPVSRHLNRPLSIRITRHLVAWPVTPNQISLFSFFLSVLAAGLFMAGGYLALLLGGILAQAASVIDGCDGEVARLKYQGSDYGGWFDAVLDRYADALLLFGLLWHELGHEWEHRGAGLAGEGDAGWVLFIGFMAIIGSFMLSYTADKYDRLMQRRIEAGGKAGLRLGRDVRVFVVFLAALTHLVWPALVLIAAVMNAEVLRRILLLRHG